MMNTYPPHADTWGRGGEKGRERRGGEDRGGGERREEEKGGEGRTGGRGGEEEGGGEDRGRGEEGRVDHSSNQHRVKFLRVESQQYVNTMSQRPQCSPTPFQPHPSCSPAPFRPRPPCRSRRGQQKWPRTESPS